MKYALTVLITIFSYLSQAEQAEDLTGIHGMVVFKHEGGWYASHMPLANSIHAHQVVFKFVFEPAHNKEFQQQLTQFHQINNLNRQLITLVPEKFDLMALMNGNLNQFQVDIYQGHFERGGEKVFEKTVVKVEKVLLVASLTSDNNGEYYVIPTSENSGLLVHRIANKNSFDQILSFTDLAVPSNASLMKQQILVVGNQGPFKIQTTMRYSQQVGIEYYLEVQDFK